MYANQLTVQIKTENKTLLDIPLEQTNRPDCIVNGTFTPPLDDMYAVIKFVDGSAIRLPIIQNKSASYIGSINGLKYTVLIVIIRGSTESKYRISAYTSVSQIQAVA
ncbi:MAG: hypothetical protein IPL26_13395 [Leptospiraceae bacterium]|nr:hypothetical protein [Leptospiraceae bacterium]